jgi:hypothetical protein
MTASDPAPAERSPAERSPAARFFRRAAAAFLIGLFAYAILWYAVFNAVTSALVASGGAVVLVAGSSVSETFRSIFEAIADFILGIFAAIADFFSGLFD